MMKQNNSTFWSECRGLARASVKEAFHSLPPRYFHAAALLLPLAIPAWACRLAFGWAADRLATQKA
jgi:hypothetical protein